MRKYKYKFGNGLAHSESKDIKMMEDMATKGYTLEKVSKWGYYKFRAAIVEECAYAIDFSDIEAKDEGFRQYIEIFSAGGWKYVTSLENLHYFKAPTGTKPIYTDGVSMAEKYEKMREMSMWWVIVTGIFAAVCAALYVIFSLFFLLVLMGAGIGLCWTMFDGVRLNKRRAEQLRDGVSTANVSEACDESDACQDENTAERYDELSKSCGRAFLLSLLLVAGLTVLSWTQFFGLIAIGSDLSSVVGGIVGALWGISIVFALYKAYGFIANMRKAARMRKTG